MDDEIANRFGDSFDTLKAGSLASNYLKNYLHLQGKTKASLKAAKFIAIAAWLESLGNTIPDGQGLSPREDGFLRMLSNIQACTTGKDEGIHLFYTNLEDKYKLKVSISQQYPIQDFMDRILTQEVDKMFSGTNLFMKTLIGMKPKEEVDQAVHQARYLKNMIGHEVGLGDGVTFDNNTQTLYKDLLDRSKAEMMQTFYKHFPPHIIVSAMEREFNAALKDKSSGITYMELADFFREDERERAFDFDTNTNDVSLTTTGIISLLKHFGILKE